MEDLEDYFKEGIYIVKLGQLDFTMTYVGTLVKDSISELEGWIRSKLNITNPDDVKAVSFAIMNSRKKKKKKSEKPKEETWKKSWETLGEEMDRLRKARKMYKEYKTTKEKHLQKQIYGLYRSDSIPLKDFKQITYDFQHDFVVLHGSIARSGPYEYKKNGQWVTLYKDYNNLKEIYPRYDYLPLKVSEKDKSHFAKEFGFAYNFRPNPDTEEIEADLVILDETQFNEIKDKDYHVSPGYHDHIEGNRQYVLDVDHVALSLGDEIGRACTGQNEKGRSCTKVRPKYHDQNLSQEVVIK